MFTRMLLAVWALAFVSIPVGGAAASVVDWTYTVGSSVYASGQMTLTGPNGVFGDSVTAISGTFAGHSITGLVANPNAPHYVFNSTGFVPYDNDVDPSTSSLDYFGIEFDAGGAEYNLFSYNADYFSYVGAGPESALETSENVYVNSGMLSIYSPPPTKSIQSLLGPATDLIEPSAPAPELDINLAEPAIDPAIAAVEPANWMLMVFGSAGMGAALRHGRRKAVAAV